MYLQHLPIHRQHSSSLCTGFPLLRILLSSCWWLFVFRQHKEPATERCDAEARNKLLIKAPLVISVSPRVCCVSAVSTSSRWRWETGGFTCTQRQTYPQHPLWFCRARFPPSNNCYSQGALSIVIWGPIPPNNQALSILSSYLNALLHWWVISMLN